MPGGSFRSSILLTSIAAILAACGGSETQESVIPAVATPTPASTYTPTPRPTLQTPVAEIRSAGAEPDEILGLSTPLLASGNEPYWTAEFAEGWITFTRPGLPLVEVPMPDLPEAQSGTLSIEAERLRVVLAEEACGEVADALSVTITFEEVDYFGCAASGEINPAVSVETNWQELIPSSLKAIDACLAATDGPRLLRALYPREEGTVGMILVDSVGRYEECGAELDAGDVAFLDPITPDQAEIWFEGEAVFSRTGTRLVCRETGAEFDVDGAGVFHPAGCR